MGFVDKKVLGQITKRLRQIWPKIPVSQLQNEYRADGRDMLRVQLPGDAALDLTEGTDGAWYAVPIVRENGEFIPVPMRRPYFFGLRTSAHPDQVAEHFYEEVRVIGQAMTAPKPESTPEPEPTPEPVAATPPTASQLPHPSVPFPEPEEDPFLEFQRDFAPVALRAWNDLSSIGLDVRLDIEEEDGDQDVVASLVVVSSGLPWFLLSVKNGYWFFTTNRYTKLNTFFPPERVAQAQNSELLAAIIAAQIASMWIVRRRPETPHWRPGFKIDRDATEPARQYLRWLAEGGSNYEYFAFEGTPAAAEKLLRDLDQATARFEHDQPADNEMIDLDLDLDFDFDEKN